MRIVYSTENLHSAGLQYGSFTGGHGYIHKVKKITVCIVCNLETLQCM